MTGTLSVTKVCRNAIRVLAVGLVVFSFGAQLFAWSGSGHGATAAMAYRGLASDQVRKNNLTNLLRSHPSFAEWKTAFDTKKPPFPADLDFGMFLFIRAATWPDDVRGATDSTLKTFDHPNWHFVDYPLRPPAFTTGPSPTPNDDVIFGLKRSFETLANKNAPLVQRAASLSWLIHLVGDVHQPLHAATLMTDTFKAPRGDVGGNDFLVFEDSAQQQQHRTTKLHSFWDGRLGSEREPDPVRALANAKALEAAHSRASLTELGAGDNSVRWSFESRDAAIANAYQFKSTMLKLQAVLPQGYAANAQQVGRRRLALAGYRLADAMKKVAF